MAILFSLFFLCCLVVGFVTVIKWVINSFSFSSGYSTNSSGSLSPQPARMMPALYNLEILKEKIVELEQKEEVTTEGMSTILRIISKSTNMEAIKVNIEDLFFQNKVTKEGMNAILDLLKPAQNIAAFSPKPVMQDDFVQEKLPPIPLFENKVEKPKIISTPRPAEPTKVSVNKHKTGFLNLTNIKTLLISGSVLTVLSAYYFVRSYWEFIPAIIKFGLLVAGTVVTAIIGALLVKNRKTPKTAEAVISIALLLVPCNVYALNVLVLNRIIWDHYISWTIGFIAMFIAAIITYTGLPTMIMGLLIGLSFSSALIFGGLALGLSTQAWFLLASAGAFVLLITSLSLIRDDKVQLGFLIMVNLLCVFVGTGLISNGFFWDTAGDFTTVGSLLILGVIYAVQARIRVYLFAYLAGICFMGTGALLLHQWAVPVYKFGLFFVPMGLAAIIRAWTFEKSGREKLASPYFHLGQLAILGSMLSILPSFSYYLDAGFGSLLIILCTTIATYAILASIYANPLYSYAGCLTALLLTKTFVWHYHFPFEKEILLFAFISFILIILATLFDKVNKKLIGDPLIFIGLGTLSISLSLLGGKWGAQFISTGTIAFNLPVEQLNTSLWVASLSVLAYGFLSITKKSIAYLYPALISATLGYLFFLERVRMPINMVNISLIIVVALIFYYLMHLLDKKNASRVFALWGEMVFIIIILGSILSDSPNTVLAIGIGTAAFLPALWIGQMDLMICFLIGVYAGHAHWFGQHYSLIKNSIALYALQLIIVNSAVIFIRSLVSFTRSEVNVLPFRIVALIFSGLSLLLSLTDFTIAWQVYLAYGIIAIIVSYLHYEGRYLYVGGLLIMLAYEFFLYAYQIKYVEAYTAPFGLLFIGLGYLNRENRETRNMLYLVGQVFLYLPSFKEALVETWQLHGIFVGIASILVMLFGMSQKNKCLVFGSFAILIPNAVIQSRQFFYSLPRWIYLGFGGITLITLGGFLEFKRETLIAMKDKVVDALEDWD